MTALVRPLPTVPVVLAGAAAFLDLYATQPLLPLLARTFQASTFDVGLTITAPTVAVALAAPGVGRLADMFGLRRVIVASQGYDVLEASDGKSAIELLARKPALVILDLGLPDIDGHDLLRRIRLRQEALPIIVLSSRGDEAGKVAALDLGADDYVTKPFGMDELFARIRAAIHTAAQA